MDAQSVAKKRVVEHFTNTRCSVCASRNPGFYDALATNTDMIHIAYHPSSPYSACLFSTQNKAQNDARTNFYDIYGGTPRFMINSVEKSSSEVQSSNVYEEFKTQTTPVDLKANVAKFGTDEIEISFDIKILANNNFGNIKYFVALVEDTVWYDAPNGEKIHYDVFRKSLTSTSNLPGFKLPELEGNLFSYSDKIKTETFWNLSRLYAIVILSDNNKKIIQAAKSTLYNPNVLSSTEIHSDADSNLSISPNPANHQIFVKSTKDELITEIQLLNGFGQMVLSLQSYEAEQMIDLRGIQSGYYFIRVINSQGIFVKKLIKN